MTRRLIENKAMEGEPTPPALDGALPFTPTCSACGYNLTGLIEDRCPECGRIGALSDSNRLGPPLRLTGAKRTSLALIATAWIASAIFDVIFGESRINTSLTGISLAVLSLIWCACDARENRVRISKWLGLAIILIFPLGVFWYFAQQRRWRSMLLALGFAVTLFLASVFIFVVEARLTSGQWPPLF